MLSCRQIPPNVPRLIARCGSKASGFCFASRSRIATARSAAPSASFHRPRAPWVPWAFPGSPRVRHPASLCYALGEMDAKNKLYFGVNLKVLRDYIADASVDLIYLGPPFNSSATYNVLFNENSGEKSAARCRPSAMHLRGKQCGKSVSVTRGCTSSAWSKA